jgi:metal-responsive CopG/Arc/MetJ family transcriptional regulator
MPIDKQKNKQILLMLPVELLEQVEQYWHIQQLPNRNEAIRSLLLAALKHLSANRE